MCADNVDYVLERIAKNDIDFLNVLISRGFKFDWDHLTLAIKFQDLDTLKVISENLIRDGYVHSRLFYSCIAKSGNIGMMEMFKGGLKSYLPIRNIHYHVRRNSIDFLRYIVESDLCAPICDITLKFAIRKNVGIEKIRYLHSLFPNIDTMDEAFIRLILNGGDTEVWDYFYGDFEINFEQLSKISDNYKKFNIYTSPTHYIGVSVRNFQIIMSHICKKKKFSYEKLMSLILLK